MRDAASRAEASRAEASRADSRAAFAGGSLAGGSLARDARGRSCVRGIRAGGSCGRRWSRSGWARRRHQGERRGGWTGCRVRNGRRRNLGRRRGRRLDGRRRRRLRVDRLRLRGGGRLRLGRLLREEVAVVGAAGLLDGTRVALDVLAEERVHEKGQVEGGRREVAGEQQRVDAAPQLGDPREARRGIRSQRAAQQACERRRQRARLAARGRDPRRRNPLQRVAPVGGLARKRLQQDEAQRVDVRALVAPARRLLRREVRALLRGQETRLSQRRPETQALDLHLAVERHDQLARPDQPVEQRLAGLVLAAVERLESRRGAARDHQRVVGSEREAALAAALQHRPHAAALDELGGEVEGRPHAADPQHLHETRAVDLGRQPGFLDEALGALSVGRDARRETQHRHEAIEARRTEPCGAVLVPERA